MPATSAQNKFWIISITLLPFIISGCASLSKDQCLNADWRQIGYSDGTKGEPGNLIDEHAKSCAEYGVRPNLDQYLQGRKRGLVNYCQAENGFTLGRNGVEANIGDCESYLKPAFLDQHRKGKEIHDIENDISSLHNRIHEHDEKIHKANNRIAEIKTELDKKSLSSDQRTTLLNEYNRLLDQKDKQARTSRELKEDADRLQVYLERRLREFGR